MMNLREIRYPGQNSKNKQILTLFLLDIHHMSSSSSSSVGMASHHSTRSSIHSSSSRWSSQWLLFDEVGGHASSSTSSGWSCCSCCRHAHTRGARLLRLLLRVTWKQLDHDCADNALPKYAQTMNESIEGIALQEEALLYKRRPAQKGQSWRYSHILTVLNGFLLEIDIYPPPGIAPIWAPEGTGPPPATGCMTGG